MYWPVLITSSICVAVRSYKDITMYPSPANISFILRSSILAYFLGCILEPSCNSNISLLITMAIPRTACRKLYSLSSFTLFLVNFLHFSNSLCKDLQRWKNPVYQIKFGKKEILKEFEHFKSLCLSPSCKLLTFRNSTLLFPL